MAASGSSPSFSWALFSSTLRLFVSCDFSYFYNFLTCFAWAFITRFFVGESGLSYLNSENWQSLSSLSASSALKSCACFTFDFWVFASFISRSEASFFFFRHSRQENGKSVMFYICETSIPIFSRHLGWNQLSQSSQPIMSGVSACLQMQ